MKKTISDPNIVKLLSELTPPNYGNYGEEYEELVKEEIKIEEKLKKDYDLCFIQKKIAEIVKKEDERREKLKIKIKSIRQLFYAEGKTERVVKQLVKMVEEQNEKIP